MKLSRLASTRNWGMGQASAPAVWGKLPSHADYIQHGIKAGEVQAWQHWLASEMRPPATAKPTAMRDLRAGERQHALDPAPAPKPAHQVPVAFVLPPGHLSHAGSFTREYVVGVIANSCDRLGREHPIIVYHSADQRWLQHQLGGAEPQSAMQALRYWLFALSQLIRHYVHIPNPDTHDDAQDQHATFRADSLELAPAIARLWALYLPSWPQRLGLAPRLPTAHAVQEVLRLAPAQLHLDAAQAVHGMPYLPWADWPDRLWSQPRTTFWQQNNQGAYVGASLRLRDLWPQGPLQA